MEQQILEVFIEAIRQVFGDTGIIIDKVGAEEEPVAEDHVITSVGITGDLKGIFMLRTDTPSASIILRAMTSGIRIAVANDRFSEIQMAALGELTNQITGRAITLLFDRQAALRHHAARGHRRPSTAKPRSRPGRLVQPHRPRPLREAHRLPRSAGITIHGTLEKTS